MTKDIQEEKAAGAARQNEVANSLPNDQPPANSVVPSEANRVLNEAKERSNVAGNSQNDNNPYARRPAEKDLAPHERRIQPEENVPGAPSPPLRPEPGRRRDDERSVRRRR